MINIGDIIYTTDFGTIESMRVAEIWQTDEGIKLVASNPMCEAIMPISNLGKFAFLSHNEAADKVRKEYGSVREIVWGEGEL